ncbi:YIP1 family protein [Longimicrobium sp.]|uniref:YIP1 family protein n=1 Tax=Longimicrobium sp. TaxID=2029185 RepID=UPI002C233606|nr:YIP1 family protein [Longimicrobium sp.]HSU15416.1 YIP1 family protein [Longimicrobium sp.]
MEYPAGGIPRTRTLVERMIGAAMLDPSVYEEVEADRNATGQAAAVVAIVAVCGAIGSIGHGGSGIVGSLVGAFIGWLLWAGLTYIIGTKVFGGTADMGEMLRTLGFAQSPGVLGILGIIPFVGGLVRFALFFWTLVAAVIAIRQALDFDTGKAVLTALLAGAVVFVVVLGIMAFFAMMFGAAVAVGSMAG